MPRIQSLDLARGFTVLFIPAIHTVMCYSQPYVYKTWLGYPLAFIAEGPGGQLFMMLMGIVFTFKLQHSSKATLLKAAGLLSAGYLLNVFKFVLPYSFGVLPNGVQLALQLDQGKAAWQLFSMGDILQFAAIALLIIHGVYRTKEYHVYALALTVLIIFASPLFWDSSSNNPGINYLLQLFTGQPPRTFFPVFLWLVYPLLGLVTGYYLQKDAARTYKLCRFLGTVCLAAGYILANLMHEHSEAGFYRTYPGGTIFHIGIVLIALFAWDWISRHFPKTSFFIVLKYMSRHITQIYIIQWILIAWLLPVFGYQTLGLIGTVEAIILTSTLSFGISILLNKYKTRNEHK